MVVAAEEDFVRIQRQMGIRIIVLDIPLLFETSAQTRFDQIWVVIAPALIQKQRVMKRPGMTEEKFRRIVQSQMPDGIKRRHADRVILTGLGRGFSFRQLRAYIRANI
jgi:dephospho-CoA kinase